MMDENKRKVWGYALEVFMPILKNAMKLAITSDGFKETFFDLAIDEVSEFDESDEVRQLIYDELEEMLDDYINNFVKAD